MKELKEIKIDVNKWSKLLIEMGFSTKSIDKILEYVEVHCGYEILFPIHFEKERTVTLPYSLKVLLQLEQNGLLDKIHFVSHPSDEVPIESYMSKYGIDSDELRTISEEAIISRIIEDTVLNLKKLLESKEIYIYILFSDIRNIDNVLHVFNRFYTKE